MPSRGSPQQPGRSSTLAISGRVDGMFRWAHVFIDVPADQVAAATEFWSAATGYGIGAPWPSHQEFVSLLPRSGSRYVHLQRIEGAPRIHLDFPSVDLDADTARLVGIGARVIGPRGHWQTLESPGGLPFCIVDEAVPAAVPVSARWADGNRSRVCQVCIDAPPSLHAAECEFWAAATGWRERDSPYDPEFASLLPPESSPVQFLLQRLDDDGGAVRAHIDLGCDDIDAEAARLVDLGATVVAREEEWIVLRDPAGQEFCATERKPDGIT